MTTDLLPKTGRLISRSAYSRELADYAAWLSTEGYTAAPIHIHLTYLGQALTRMTQDSGPRDLADVEKAFDPGSGPPTRRTLFAATSSQSKDSEQSNNQFPPGQAPPPSSASPPSPRRMHWLRRDAR